MPELQTPDGERIEAARAEINADFAAAMNSDDDAHAAPPPRRKATAQGGPAKRGRPAKDDRARILARPAATALTDEQRHLGAKGIAQVTAGVALVAAKATGNMAFAADAVTITGHADALADACVQTAASSPAFAAALDKVCAAGPYAAMIGVGVAIVSQLARNHAPTLQIPGTVHPGELLAAPAEQDQEQEQPEAA